MTRGWAVAAAVASALVLAGCGATTKAGQPFNDAPVSPSVDLSAAKIYAMPDGFGNVAVKCVGTTAIATLFHGDALYGSVAISENSALCGAVK